VLSSVTLICSAPDKMPHCVRPVWFPVARSVTIVPDALGTENVQQAVPGAWNPITPGVFDRFYTVAGSGGSSGLGLTPADE